MKNLYNKTHSMHSYKRAAFSPDSKYFACYNPDDKLLVWEISNNVFIDCKFDSRHYTACSSLHWIPLKHKSPSPKKARLIKTSSSETQLLGIGTTIGDVLLYDVYHENLYLHLVGCHSEAVNDMCFYSSTDSLFTCSSDKSIAIWDILTGKQKSKWKASDDPVSSICVINENSMLSSSTSITLWNISEKKAIKRFNGHSSEIFKLLLVNAVSLNSCYFLSAAVNDAKINAWSISSNESETPVASFVLLGKIEDLDISKEARKDKPLLLSAVTKDGFFHLFEHVLNGNVNQPINPKVYVKVLPGSSSPPIISLKLCPDSDSCIIAYGSSKDNFQFQHLNYQKLKEKQAKNKTLVSEDRSPVVTETSKTEENVLLNGLTSQTNCSESNKKKTQLDSVSSYRRKLRSSVSLSTENVDTLNPPEIDDLKSSKKSRNHMKVNVKNPKSCADSLIKGLHTGNEELKDAVFLINDVEIIRQCVENLPSSSLKLVLEELSNRLCQRQSYPSTLSKWLKEISDVHLNQLMQNEETEEVLHAITKYLDSLKIHKSLTKMSALQGLLSLTTQSSSSDESNSDSEEGMEL